MEGVDKGRRTASTDRAECIRQRYEAEVEVVEIGRE